MTEYLRIKTLYMHDTIKFDYLKYHHESIPVLARYSYDTWRSVYDKSGQNYNDVVSSYLERINTDKLPLALVVLDSGKIIGTGALKLMDLDVRPEYSPWLGGMYIVEEYRGKGIGSLLIKQLIIEAERIGLDALYLWTPYSQSLYERYGWQTIENIDYCGYDISIMIKTLHDV